MTPKSTSENAVKESVQCPFCLGYETELYALFGQWLSTSQYYCKHCRTVFEWIKWERGSIDSAGAYPVLISPSRPDE